MISKGKVIRIGLFFALSNFCITAALGALLRFNSMSPITGFIARYWTHSHSHTGFLGWIFTALVTLGYGMLLPDSPKINRRIYRLLIYFQLSVLGMLVTFPFMGYAAPSIIFSTFHLVLSFIFAFIFYRSAEKNDLSSKFMKVALVFMLISNIGPLALGPIMVAGLKGSPIYEMAVYFYLHFQYNGWFTLAVFALFIKLIEKKGIGVDERKGKLMLNLLIYGIISTLALSAFGFEYKTLMRMIGFTGAAFQLGAGFIFVGILYKAIGHNKLFSNTWIKWFMGLSLFSWLLKVILQFMSVFPVFSDFVYISRDAIMTYLHLSFLGFTSCFLFGIFIINKVLSVSNVLSRVALGLFSGMVIFMELTIGLKSLPQYLDLQNLHLVKTSLFIQSMILLISLIVLLFFLSQGESRSKCIKRITR